MTPAPNPFTAIDGYELMSEHFAFMNMHGESVSVHGAWTYSACQCCRHSKYGFPVITLPRQTSELASSSLLHVWRQAARSSTVEGGRQQSDVLFTADSERECEGAFAPTLDGSTVDQIGAKYKRAHNRRAIRKYSRSFTFVDMIWDEIPFMLV